MKTIEIRAFCNGYMYYEEQLPCEWHLTKKGIVKCINTLDRKECITMQYIGRKDKKGNKIFEGDLVTTKRNGEGIRRTGVVNYDEHVGAYYLGDYGMLSDYCIYDTFERIGNIHENKELLKELLK